MLDAMRSGILADLDGLLAADPADLLGFASSLADMMSEPENALAAGKRDPDAPTLTDFIHVLRTIETRQTDSLLLVLKEMQDDEALRETVRREVAARRLPLHGWLLRLERLRPVRAIRLFDAWDDAGNIMIDLESPTRRPITIVALVDGTIGTAVKDAFLADETVADLVARLVDGDDSGVFATEDLSLADARARLTSAIARGREFFPPFENETWPGIRPFVEWMLRLMPDGGDAPEWVELSDSDRGAVVTAFLASPHAARLAPAERAVAGDIAETLIDFTSGVGDGNPLPWSPLRVEIFFKDWIMRKVVADAEYLRAIPGVLRAFVRFADAEIDRPESLTLRTLAEVDRLTGAYLREIGSGPSGGTSMLDVLTRMGVDIENDPEAQRLALLAGALGALSGIEEGVRDELVAALGGEDALATIDAAPLPDEPLILDGLAPDVADRLHRIDALSAPVATTLVGPELRTSARRLLRRLALTEPGLFQGSAKDTNTAGAVLWIAGHINDMLGTLGEGFTVTSLTRALKLASNPSTRAKTLLKALGVTDTWEWLDFPSLGDPALLTGQRRADLLAEIEEIDDESDDDEWFRSEIPPRPDPR